MTRPILKRVNFFDGQEISETDMDVEQTAWHDSVANNTDFLVGTGVEKEFSIQKVLFDTNSVPASVTTLINGVNFDGAPLYTTDSLGQSIFLQPSDSTNGNQFEVELSGAALDGSNVTRVYLFGTIFGGSFVHEVISFETNEPQVTTHYFTQLISIMTQDFLGNQNTTIDGIASRNLGGCLRIMESLSMTLARDAIMAQQAIEPNMDYVNFKPSTSTKTLDNLLDEIAATEGLSADDLKINVTATSTRNLSANNSTGLIVGQKFKATTNNIQKISILLAVEENTLAVPGEEFDWSGDIVIGVRALQTTTQCPTDTIPNTSIEFDPELSPIAEVSFDQNGLAELGVSLNGSPQVVDFIFTQSLLANPNIEPSIEPDKYYIITIRRSGNISNGTIVLQEAANTNASPDETDETIMAIFSQNVWTDVSDTDLWFRVYTDAIRLTSGTAFDSGVQITTPKIKTNETTGVDETYIEGNISFIDVSQTTKNYVMVQKSISFTDAVTHPSTGNRVFSRIEDVPDIAVVSESTLTTLIDAGSDPIVIGSARDTNPVGNPNVTGVTEFPGLLRSSTFSIINPTSDIQLNNFVGSILVPNSNKPELKYKITKIEIIDDAYGDVDGDGTIGLDDITRAQALNGYSKNLQSGTVPSAEQKAAIVAGSVTMEEIIRADVTNNGIINIFDTQMIQQNVAFGTAFTAGSSFRRAVVTVENLIDPLTTTVDMISADSTFNYVPFVSLPFRIDFVPLWAPHNIEITDLRRFIPKTFTQIESTDITGSVPNGGKNTSFVPGDILLGGDILSPDGSVYKIDMETSTIAIDLPEGSTQGEVDIFSNFIKGQMSFYDGTIVATGALEADQVRVSAAIQSFVKDSSGLDFDSGDGYVEVETTVALLYNQTSGLFLTVFLKKAGFNNTEVSVSAARLQELLVFV